MTSRESQGRWTGTAVMWAGRQVVTMSRSVGVEIDFEAGGVVLRVDLGVGHLEVEE